MILVSLVAALVLLWRIPSDFVRIRWPRRERSVDVLLIARLLALSVASGRPIGSGLQDIASLLPPAEATVVARIAPSAKDRDAATERTRIRILPSPRR